LQRLAILEGYGQGVDKLAKEWGLTSHDVIKFVLGIQKIDMLDGLVKSANTKVIYMDSSSTDNNLEKSIIRGNEAHGMHGSLKKESLEIK
jgi:hypothetical protein